MLPLTKLVLEAHALSDLERRDDTSLDLLTGLPGGFAGLAIFSAGLIEMQQIGRALAVPIEVASVVFRGSVWLPLSARSVCADPGLGFERGGGSHFLSPVFKLLYAPKNAGTSVCADQLLIRAKRRLTIVSNRAAACPPCERNCEPARHRDARSRAEQRLKSAL
jgi:hypothetical protein